MNLINSTDAKRETILEVYRQVCNDTRAYMELRFKHFGTFVVLTTLLGALAFNFQPLATYRPHICLFAIALTVLFWLLDYRTSLYHRTAIGQAFKCQEALASPFAQPPKLKRSVSASLVTNLIFGTILLFWIMICSLLFAKPFSTSLTELSPPTRPNAGQPSEQNPIINSVKSETTALQNGEPNEFVHRVRHKGKDKRREERP